MKTIIYFLLTIMGFIGSVTGIIRLGSYGVTFTGTSILYPIGYTLVSMGAFILCGYALVKRLKNGED